MMRQLLIVLAFALAANAAYAQNPLEDYVLETRGDTLVIADFFDAEFTANTLGSVIVASSVDVPPGRVYMLHAGSNGTIDSGNMALYLQSAPITAQGRPLVIVGEYCGQMAQVRVELTEEEAAECRPPTMSGYEADGAGVLLTLGIDNDLTMKNLHFTSAHTQGAANWSFIDIEGDGVKVHLDNVLAEHNRWIWVQSNGNPGTSLRIEDSYMVNATDQNSRRNGGVYDADVATDSIWVENTTHVQNAGMQYKFRAFSPTLALFNHNTFANAAGQVFLGFGYMTKFVVTNNLFTNSNYQPYYPGIDYTEFYPADTEVDEFQPHGIINLAPLPTNTAGETYVNAVNDSLFSEAERKVLVDGNAVYWDPQLLQIGDDLNEAGFEGDICSGDNCVTGDASLDWTSQAILANQRTESMFEDDGTWPLLTWGTWYDDAGAPGYVDGPNMVQELYDWGFDAANSNVTNSDLLPKLREEGNEAGNEIEGEDTNNWIIFDWPVAVNLNYTNETYLNGGYGGFPVGDLNWFPAEKDAWLAQRGGEVDAIMAALDAGTVIIGTDLEEVGGEVPGSINLEQNYPNPFSLGNVTQIAFSLPQTDDVQLSVYDALGRRVATLVNDRMAAGNYTVDWSGHSASGQVLSSGVYFYTLKAGDRVETRQMVFVK